MLTLLSVLACCQSKVQVMMFVWVLEVENWCGTYCIMIVQWLFLLKAVMWNFYIPTYSCVLELYLRLGLSASPTLRVCGFVLLYCCWITVGYVFVWSVLPIFALSCCPYGLVRSSTLSCAFSGLWLNVWYCVAFLCRSVYNLCAPVNLLSLVFVCNWVHMLCVDEHVCDYSSVETRVAAAPCCGRWIST